jgi:hypothetical protein
MTMIIKDTENQLETAEHTTSFHSQFQFYQAPDFETQSKQ